MALDKLVNFDNSSSIFKGVIFQSNKLSSAFNEPLAEALFIYYMLGKEISISVDEFNETLSTNVVIFNIITINITRDPLTNHR